MALAAEKANHAMPYGELGASLVFKDHLRLPFKEQQVESAEEKPSLQYRERQGWGPPRYQILTQQKKSGLPRKESQ